MKITVITDNIKSWYIPYGNELQNQLIARGHDVSYVHLKTEISEGDVCFILSCVHLLQDTYLLRNKNNIVVHASDLPTGRGWSPLQWQVLEGKNIIPLTMIEAVSGVDEGPYYMKSQIVLDGTELLYEMRRKLAAEINNMCIQYIEQRDSITPKEQTGKPTFYPKRTTKDDELDINKTIHDSFNQLRVADNERHPVHFFYNGKKYYIKVYDEASLNSDEY